MKHWYSCFVALLLCSITANAQEKLKEKMNEIKLNEDFLWSEATMAARDSAASIALSQLIGIVEENNINATAVKIRSLVKYIYIPRGENTRAFAYVRRESLTSDSVQANVTELQDMHQEVEAQIEPVVVSEASITPTSPVAITSPVEPADPVVSQNTAEGNAQIGTSVLMTISQCEQVTDVARCLRDFKNDGSIKDFGIVKNKAQLTDNVYLVIFDEARTVKAILAPSIGNVRKNLVSGEADDLKNYSGHAVLWFE